MLEKGSVPFRGRGEEEDMSVKGYGEAECSVCGSYHCEAFYCKECFDEAIKQARAEVAKEIFEWGESQCIEHLGEYTTIHGSAAIHPKKHTDCDECWKELKAHYRQEERK